MKRIFSLLLAICVALALAGCSEKAKTEEPERTQVVLPIEDEARSETADGDVKTEEPPLSPGLPTVPEVTPTPDDFYEPDYEEQLWLISDMVDIWALPDEDWGQVRMYAVTDLDGNGRLEIVTSEMGGSGMYSTNSYYEVDEERTRVVQCADEWARNSSEPDIMQESFTVYCVDGVRWFIMTDILRNGFAEQFEIRSAQSLTDGTIVHRRIATHAYYSTVDEDDNVVTTEEFTADGAVITEEDFEALNHEFDGAEAQTVTVGWVEIGEDDDIFDRLAESWNGWSVSDAR